MSYLNIGLNAYDVTVRCSSDDGKTFKLDLFNSNGKRVITVFSTVNSTAPETSVASAEAPELAETSVKAPETSVDSVEDSLQDDNNIKNMFLNLCTERGIKHAEYLFIKYNRWSKLIDPENKQSIYHKIPLFLSNHTS
jgi:hypothetical protein